MPIHLERAFDNVSTASNSLGYICKTIPKHLMRPYGKEAYVRVELVCPRLHAVRIKAKDAGIFYTSLA
jgi:hypothetical protein